MSYVEDTMKTNLATSIVLVTALLLLYSCAASKVAKNSPVGAWDYTVKNTPNGDISGTMTIQQNGATYTGNLSSDAGAIDLNDMTIEDNKLSSRFYYQGTSLQLNGDFSEDTFTGSVVGGGGSFPVEATRASSQ